MRQTWEVINRLARAAATRAEPMSAPKRTPGWTVRREVIYGREVWIVTSPLGDVARGLSRDDAHIVAASHDMLAALQGIITAVEEAIGAASPAAELMIEDARRAIALAEGWTL